MAEKPQTNILQTCKSILQDLGLPGSEENIALIEKKLESLLNYEKKKMEMLELAESRFKTIFEQSPLSIQICTKDGKTIRVNPAWKKLWDIPEEVITNFILKDYNMLKDPHLRAHGVLPFIERGYAGEVTRVPVIQYDPREMGVEGTPKSVEGLIYPLKDEKGNVKEVVLIHIDVTEQEKFLKAIRKNERTLDFLSKLTSILISTLDYEKTIHHIAEACVPEFADGCIIDLVEDGKIVRLLSRHHYEETQKDLDLLAEKFTPTMGSPQPSTRAIRSGEPDFMPDELQQDIIDRTVNKEHTELIRKIGIRSHIAVPLIIRGKVIGAISLMLTTDRPKFTKDDVVIAQELARRASLALENAKLYRQSQSSISLRDDFISIASHELKTPITSMQLQLQSVEKLAFRPDVKTIDVEVVKKLTHSSLKQIKRITHLVEDMLDISRINSGKLNITFTDCNISQLVHEILNRFADQLSLAGIKVKTHIEENVHALCDAFRFEQVVTNLLSNAIRYGNKKPITITLSKEDQTMVLKIKDEGIGIDKIDHEKIFHRFERATSSSHDISGLGLGLYIAREIINEHKGTIEVESQTGHGSTFIVKVPLDLSII